VLAAVFVIIIWQRASELPFSTPDGDKYVTYTSMYIKTGVTSNPVYGRVVDVSSNTFEMRYFPVPGERDE
jgi:hypothetical protein